ncbi:hypothetical protein [Mycolicibacterium tusciae]|uniref:hypothetical protein n=1 Tax=Mycolicibacterium tusciae TaxID=75922 RepID=UPI00024A2988|nr:hypothetical protein [Mycolicibacterium tusciae]
MSPVAQWFSPLTEYLDRCDQVGWDGKKRWYQREWIDHYTKNLRVIVGDVFAEAEIECGDYIGPKIAVDLSLVDRTGQFDPFFDGQHWHAQFEDHSFGITIWRWGIYVAVRGRRIPRSL